MPAVERGLDAVLAILHEGVGATYPAAALSCGRGRIELAASVGSAATTTWFDLASLTKALGTSVLAMRLHAAGKLELDVINDGWQIVPLDLGYVGIKSATLDGKSFWAAAKYFGATTGPVLWFIRLLKAC